MKMDLKKTVFLAAMALGAFTAFAQQPGELRGQNGDAGKSEKTKWFTDAKFGLKYDSHKPLIFIDQTIAVVTVKTPGEWNLHIRPDTPGNELFRLRQVIVEPLK